jgi:hypothetical protein
VTNHQLSDSWRISWWDGRCTAGDVLAGLTEVIASWIGKELFAFLCCVDFAGRKVTTCLKQAYEQK